MKLTVKQTIALDLLEDDSTEEVLFGGAAGGGKTKFGCYWQLKNRLKMPGTRGFIGRAKFNTLLETTLLTFFDVAKEQGLIRGKHFDLTGPWDKENKNCILIKNGSLIFLRDLFLYPADPEFDELGSLEITDAFIDECSQVTPKAREVLSYRIRYKHNEYGLIPKTLYATNPFKGWGYDEFFKAEQDGTIDDNKKFVPAFIWDNPHASESYVESLKRKKDGPEKQRLYYGNWDYADDPEVLCDYDAVSDMFTNDHVQPGDEKFLSADLAMQGRDRFVLGLWAGMVCYIRKDKGKSDGKEIEQDIKEVMIMGEVPHSKSVVDSDGMGAYLESYLKGIKQFHAGAQAINHKEFANLKSECAYKLAELVNKRMIKIVCSEEQKNRIKREMAVLKAKSIDADESRKRIIKKEEMKIMLGGKSPDYLDMLIMKMFFHVKPQFVVAAA